MTNLRGVFVTGTDTGVGKTHIGTAAIKALVEYGIRVIPRKPVESGCEIVNDRLIPADAAKLQAAAGRPARLDEVCPYRFKHALSPERAARIEGSSLSITDLERACVSGIGVSDFVWIEGAGGFYSPMASDGLNADLAVRLGLPVVLVAADRLGCINHVLLTVSAIRSRDLKLAAVVLNQITPNMTPALNNAEDIKQRLDCSLVTVSHCEIHEVACVGIAQLAELLY